MTLHRHVALLRGINVGRAKRVAMADLRALLEGLGYAGVRTLLNSGNAVFDAPSGRTGADAHARRIAEAMAAGLGVEAAVVVKTAAQLEAAAAGHPLAAVATDPSRLLVAFVQDDATLAPLQALAAGPWAPEALAVGPHAAYLWCADGIIESRVAKALGRALGERATTRNWATVEKLVALVRAPAG